MNKIFKLNSVFAVIFFMLAGVNSFGQTVNPQTTGNTTNSNTYTRPDADQRFKNYLNNAFGPTSYIGPAFSATFRQIRNKPPEWEKSTTVFFRRFGDRVGRNVIEETVIYGLDEAFKVDSNYYRSKKKDFGSKFSNAIVSTFTARNSKGKRVVGVPQIAGAYSSAFVANEVWMPKRLGYKDSFREGTISLATKAGFNLFREFILKK